MIVVLADPSRAHCAPVGRGELRRRLAGCAAWLLSAGSGLLAGCAAEAPTTTNSLRLHTLPGCAPARIERVVVEALGDYGVRSDAVGALDFGAEADPAALAGLPREAQQYRLAVEQAGFRGYALMPALPGGARGDALLLPLGAACTLGPLSDVYTPGLALAFAGSELVAAGLTEADGVGASRALLRIAIDVPGVTREPSGLYVPRVLAGAVSVGAEAWLVGGAAETRAGTRALDTFERYAGGQVGGLGRLAVGRVAPAVLALADGSVLVAGGAARVGQAQLTSFERLGADGGDGVLLTSVLPGAPDAVAAYAGDGGRVWLLVRYAGGVRVFVLDTSQDALVELAAPDLPDGASLAFDRAVALPGDRLAALELDGAGLATGRLWLALGSDEQRLVGGFLPSFAGFAPAVAAALADGRMLVLGARGGEGEALLLDPGRASLARHALPSAPAQLVARGDGSFVALGPDGAFALREETLSRFDNPGGTLTAEDVELLALDAAGRFTRDGLALEAAEAGARFDLATLRYEHVQITVRARGPAELLFTRADGASRSVALGEAEVGPALCTLPSEAGELITLERTADVLTLRAAAGSRRCLLDGMEGPLSLGVRLGAGARVEELRVVRP
jgi:hypothetical protein